MGEASCLATDADVRHACEASRGSKYAQSSLATDARARVAISCRARDRASRRRTRRRYAPRRRYGDRAPPSVRLRARRATGARARAASTAAATSTRRSPETPNSSVAHTRKYPCTTAPTDPTPLTRPVARAAPEVPPRSWDAAPEISVSGPKRSAPVSAMKVNVAAGPSEPARDHSSSVTASPMSAPAARSTRAR